jgi:hypothetical protein
MTPGEKVMSTFVKQCSIFKIRTRLPGRTLVLQNLGACEQSIQDRGLPIACVTACTTRCHFVKTIRHVPRIVLIHHIALHIPVAG